MVLVELAYGQRPQLTRLSESAGTWEQRSEANLFFEANKVKFCAVLSQNPECCNLRVMHTLIFYENMLFKSILWWVMNHSVRGRSLPVRGPASLWKTQPPFERPGLYGKGLASLTEAQPPCERPDLPVRGPASLWEAWPPCERPGLPLRGCPPCKGLFKYYVITSRGAGVKPKYYNWLQFIEGG